MLLQAPVKFALQDYVAWLCQSRRNRWDKPRIGRPVLTAVTVTTADGLLQLAVAIYQGHRYAIYLGLNPEVIASLDPVGNRLFVSELHQAGLPDWMR